MARAVLCILMLAACTDTHERFLPVDAAAPTPSDGSPVSDGPSGNDGLVILDGGPCSPQSRATVCITGTVRRFIDPTMVAQPTSTSGLVVRAYDPIAYVTDRTAAQPLATSDVLAGGAFVLDSVLRPGSGLVAVVVETAMPSGAYVPTGVIVAPPPPPTFDGVTAWFIEGDTMTTWEAQAGSIPGCNGGTLLGCGMWIGEYVDSAGTPVANVQPSRPGDEPTPSGIFCFARNRLTLTTVDVTDGTGLCLLSPDDVVMHTGMCAAGGCSCGGAPCSPAFPSVIGGAASGAVLVETFFAQ